MNSVVQVCNACLIVRVSVDGILPDPAKSCPLCYSTLETVDPHKLLFVLELLETWLAGAGMSVELQAEKISAENSVALPKASRKLAARGLERLVLYVEPVPAEKDEANTGLVIIPLEENWLLHKAWKEISERAPVLSDP